MADLCDVNRPREQFALRQDPRHVQGHHRRDRPTRQADNEPRPGPEIQRSPRPGLSAWQRHERRQHGRFKPTRSRALPKMVIMRGRSARGKADLRKPENIAGTSAIHGSVRFHVVWQFRRPSSVSGFATWTVTAPDLCPGRSRVGTGMRRYWNPGVRSAGVRGVLQRGSHPRVPSSSRRAGASHRTGCRTHRA